MNIRKIFIIFFLFALILSSADFGFRGFFLASPASAKAKKSTKLKKAKTPEATLDLPVKIIGDSLCLKENQKAFSLLEEKAPAHYKTAVQYIGAVECAPSGSGMYVKENPPRYKAGAATIAAGTIWFSGTLVHEACHSRQYRDYLESHSTSAVPLEIFSGQAAEKQCLDAQYDALKKMGAGLSTLDYLKNIINTNYWNIDYASRWW